MKMRLRIFICLFAGLIALSTFAMGSTETVKAKKKPSAAHARITRAEAEKTALKEVPNGIVKEGELEREKGRLIWSFDIATPGTPNITEVQVDARTGKIVSKTTETPAKEAHEAATEAKKDENASTQTQKSEPPAEKQ